MVEKFMLPQGIVKFVKGKKIHGGQYLEPSEVGLTLEEAKALTNAIWMDEPVKEKKKNAVRNKRTGTKKEKQTNQKEKKEKEVVDGDLNGDGVFDSKDKSIAAKVLRKSTKKKKGE